MSLKIGYSDEEYNGITLSEGANESALQGASQLELVKWLGGFFLKDLYKVQNKALTLNIAISEETPEQVAFIADLLFKGITKEKSCVTKLNVVPLDLFTKEQYDVINQKLKDNQAALNVATANAVKPTTAAKPTSAAPVTKASPYRFWSNALLVAIAFGGFWLMFNMPVAIAATVGLVLGAKIFKNIRAQENVALKQNVAAQAQQSTQPDFNESKDRCLTFNQLIASVQPVQKLNQADLLENEVKSTICP